MELVDERHDRRTMIENVDETIFNAVHSGPAGSIMSGFEIFENEELCPFVVSISLQSQWHCHKSPEIELIECLISKVMDETSSSCNDFSDCDSFGNLCWNFDLVHNRILSQFVDIDELIDVHGADIANLESVVLPYLSTNRRMLDQLTGTVCCYMVCKGGI